MDCVSCRDLVPRVRERNLLTVRYGYHRAVFKFIRASRSNAITAVQASRGSVVVGGYSGVR
jgi:hypothetical protein